MPPFSPADLGRGINLGNALESPRDASWGVELEAHYFPAIRNAGFDSVRIPARWSDYAAAEPPYTIEPEFFATVDRAVAQALSNDLAVVVNVHHYEELMRTPEQHRERFLALWRQIAEHYKDAPDSVVLELCNEPCHDMSDEFWNELVADTIPVIRATHPDRWLMVGPTQWNQIHKLHLLELPQDDRRIIVTFHYYEPMAVTHQGASWIDNSDRWLGTKWEGTEGQKEDVCELFETATQWSREHERPIYLGEFGVYKTADMATRTNWTAFVAREAERRGFTWAYWEFCSGFGAYDPEADTWRTPLLQALLPEQDG
jgi:endoglucanase